MDMPTIKQCRCGRIISSEMPYCCPTCPVEHHSICDQFVEIHEIVFELIGTPLTEGVIALHEARACIDLKPTIN